MSYVIYNKETTVLLSIRSRSVGCYVDSFKTEGAAKAALTRQTKKGLLGDRAIEPADYDNGFRPERKAYVKEDFAIAETRDFNENIEKTVTRRNAMSGETFEESINAPYSTSPASENYWCS